jgi:hypothetical protein
MITISRLPFNDDDQVENWQQKKYFKLTRFLVIYFIV